MVYFRYFCFFIFGIFAPCHIFGFVFASPEIWRESGWSETDFSRHSVDFSEIIAGGPPKDGIPSIDSPIFIPVSTVEDLALTEPVLSVEINGESRAYPLRILIWHEIVNDHLGGIPIAVTYCPLCNSGVIFDRRIGDRVLDFGTTGLLRHSDLVMYDRQTQSWWQQFTGEAIVGRLTGMHLSLIPARLESFLDFRSRFPQGDVLTPPKTISRPYGRSPYAGYDSSSRPFLYMGDLPSNIPALSRVVIFRDSNGLSHAIALSFLRKVESLRVGDIDISWHSGQNSVLDKSDITKGRDVGNVVVKNITNNGDIVYDVTFAFVVHAFHPDLLIRIE